MEVQAEPRVVLLTADRFSPWNGTRLDQPDHIWADLPLHLNLPLLVFNDDGIPKSLDEYRFGEAIDTTEGRPSRWGTSLLVIQSLVLSLRFGPRLLLGMRPLLAASRAKRALLRQPSPGDLTRWHRVVLQLSRHLQRNPVDVVVFHGEFDPWGTAVVWACRRAGVACVAHQHYAIPANTRLYRGIGRLRRFAPDGLLCVSRHQQRLWALLPLPVGYGGSRRPVWNLANRPSFSEERAGQLLIVPSVGDTAQIQREIAKRSAERFHVRPHPGRMSGWNLPNVVLYRENLVDLLARFDAVVTSSPSPTVTLTAARRPFVKMRGDQPDGTCTCGERRVYSSLGEVLYSLAEGVPLREITSLGCEHNLTDPPAREEYIEEVKRALVLGQFQTPVENRPRTRSWRPKSDGNRAPR